MIKKLYLDLETTGVNPRRHSIHQIAGCVDFDGEIVESFNIRVQPNPKAEISPKALKIAGKTLNDLKSYQDMKSGYRQFTRLVDSHVSKFDKKDKFHLVGFNNRAFDDRFLRAWFAQNGDDYFGSRFWSDSLDVMVLASEYLHTRRSDMPNFQLGTVARELGLYVDENRTHDAMYDVELTREIYLIVTGKNTEL